MGVVWPAGTAVAYVHVWLKLVVVDHRGTTAARRERHAKGRDISKQPGMQLACIPGHPMARHGYRRFLRVRVRDEVPAPPAGVPGVNRW